MAIHPTAIVDKRAELAGDVDVGPYCIIDGHVRVEAGCRLHNHVYLTGWTRIEENCVIHPGALIGHEPQDKQFDGSRSYCRIGRGTVIREYVTIHRGTLPESATIIGPECFLLAGSHIAHNCALGSEVTLINNVLLGGHVEIGDRATLGGGVGVHQFTRIGELAMIAGTARAVMDIIPFALADTEGRIAGLNRVGMRRADITTEETIDLQDAYHTLLSSNRLFRDAAAHVIEQVSTPAGRRLAEFLKGESKRGIAGRARKSKTSEDG